MGDYDNSGDRFGRVQKFYPYIGELRRQKKKPHKEVFYTYVYVNEFKKYILRSIMNCSNDQLVESIRALGEKIEAHTASRPDGEEVLDILYAELGRRSDVTEYARSQKDRSLSTVIDSPVHTFDTVSQGQT